MSAFIVSKQTMDLAVVAIVQSPLTFTIKMRCVDLNKQTAAGRRLYQMNLAAILQRYDDCTKDDAPGPVDISDIHENYVFVEVPPEMSNTDIDAGWTVDPGDDRLRLALSCLRYQCSEGDVPDTWPEYQQINHICESPA